MKIVDVLVAPIPSIGDAFRDELRILDASPAHE
jgi:hypothetical protein